MLRPVGGESSRTMSEDADDAERERGWAEELGSGGRGDMTLLEGYGFPPSDGDSETARESDEDSSITSGVGRERR